MKRLQPLFHLPLLLKSRNAGNSSKNHFPQLPALTAVLALVLITGCDRSSPIGPDNDPQPVALAVQANLGANSTIAEIVVQVTADDIPSPIATNLRLTDTDSDGDYDRAEGTITVPVGSDRTFTAEAFDAEGYITHDGSVTADVRPNDQAINIPLNPNAVGVPIEVIVGAYAITIDPATAQLDPGDTQQFTVTVTDATGVAVENPALEWASTNPAVMAVDEKGLVTGQTSGTARVIASYEGIAASAGVLVGEGPLHEGKIAFASNRGGNYNIYVMNTDGSVQQLTTTTGTNGHPAWSPDGTKIAFVSDRELSGEDQIYVMNSDGSEQERLTTPTGSVIDREPAWSPDGTKIAMHGNTVADGTNVLVMNADGSEREQLTTEGGESPAWSPDGTKIAFVRFIGESHEILVMNADGSGEERLTTNGGDSPTWSPDGTKIAFVNARDGNDEIYVMNADGSGQERITTNEASDRSPAWTR